MRISSLAFIVCTLLTACASRSPGWGDPKRGAAEIRLYGCGSCHTVPGVPGAHGRVGPSLAGVGGRTYIAGRLPNQPDNLRRWIREPHSINPGTAMPNTGVTERDAGDMAAYLYSLK